MNRYQCFQKPKGRYTKIEDIATAVNLQIVNFTSNEVVINYKYNGESLKLSLIFKSTTDCQTSIFSDCSINDRDDLGQDLGLRTDVLYCEGKTIDAPSPCDLARFHTLFVDSKFLKYSNVYIVKSQLLRAFTFREGVKDEDLTVLFLYANRASTKLQYRKIKPKTFKTVQFQIELRDLKGGHIPFASLSIVILNLHFCKKSTFI